MLAHNHFSKSIEESGGSSKCLTIPKKNECTYECAVDMTEAQRAQQSDTKTKKTTKGEKNQTGHRRKKGKHERDIIYM